MLLTLLIAAASITPVHSAAAITNAVAANKGKVVVVKVWATWCGSCMEEFPAFLKTMKEFPEVAVVSVSADDPKAVERYVQPFLDRVGMPYDTLLLDDVKSEAMIASMDKRWDGTLPALFLYDREGKLVKRVNGPVKNLRQLLSKS